MHFQNVAVSLMKPGNHHDFIAYRSAVQCLGKFRINFEPGVGRALVSLARRCLATDQLRVNDPNWFKYKTGFHHTSPFATVIFPERVEGGVGFVGAHLRVRPETTSNQALPLL